MSLKREQFPSLVDRFIKYVKIDTQSDEKSDTRPSTAKQHVLLDLLVKELRELGLKDVEKTDYAAVMATLPANLPPGGPEAPTIGFIAHVDTYHATPGGGVRPQVHKDYRGGDLLINKEKGIVIEAAANTGLGKLIGDDIITSDGTTLLGADDKAGVAEIMEALTILATDPSIHHGPIRVAFTVDEEIGRGADGFDIEHFGAACAYTMDGSALGEVEDETFCADSAVLTISGYDVHPGYGKGKLINAVRVAADLVGRMHRDKLPETTEGRQAYLHPISIEGDVSRVKITFLVRDFQEGGLKVLEDLLCGLADEAVGAFPGSKVDTEIKEYYRNMKYELDKHPKVMEIARKAMRELGIEPVTKPIRGGTDGSRLTLMGMPTPNLFAGGENFHSVKEYVSVQTMEKAVRVIVGIAVLWAAERAK